MLPAKLTNYRGRDSHVTTKAPNAKPVLLQCETSVASTYVFLFSTLALQRIFEALKSKKNQIEKVYGLARKSTYYQMKTFLPEITLEKIKTMESVIAGEIHGAQQTPFRGTKRN